MPNYTFVEENGYIVCYRDGVEISRAKKVDDGTTPEEVVNIINNEIEANPALSGTEPELTGLRTGDNKYIVPNDGHSLSGSESISIISDVVSVKDDYIDSQFLTASEMEDLIEEVYGSEYIL